MGVLQQLQALTDTFISNFHSPTVRVLVGSEKTPYYLHSRLLSNKCPSFKGREDFQAKCILNNPIPISFEATIYEVFDMLTEYIYTSVYNNPIDRSVAEIHELHIRLIYFADFLMVDDLKEMALNKMQTLLKKSSWPTQNELTAQAIIQLLNIVYENTIEYTLLGSSRKEDADQDIEDD